MRSAAAGLEMVGEFGSTEGSTDPPSLETQRSVEEFHAVFSGQTTQPPVQELKREKHLMHCSPSKKGSSCGQTFDSLVGTGSGPMMKSLKLGLETKAGEVVWFPVELVLLVWLGLRGTVSDSHQSMVEFHLEPFWQATHSLVAALKISGQLIQLVPLKKGAVSGHKTSLAPGTGSGPRILSLAEGLEMVGVGPVVLLDWQLFLEDTN